MSTVYGYCRVSTKNQRIERQVSNIRSQYPNAVIYEEEFTGTKIEGRKELEKLLKNVHSGDTIVFDEVSRMSRNAEEGFDLYKDLFQKGVHLVFLKEPQINTETYRESMQRVVDVGQINSGDRATDKFMETVISALNQYVMDLAEKQIRIAFGQAQAEVDHLHVRTREGMIKSGAAAKISAARTGKHYQTQKSRRAKNLIRKLNRSFGGPMQDKETWETIRISKMTFYKYKKELMIELAEG